MSLHESTALLLSMEGLEPSAHDVRLRRLVRDVAGRRGELPLGALVEVARAVQGFGFDEEMASLLELVMDSTSFLPPDVVLAFARTLSVAAQRGATAVPSTSPGRRPSPAVQEARATVFRILGEHVQEAMFDAAPAELAEALLALAVFYCSRRGGAPDPSLYRSRHHEVFATAAALLLGGRAAAAPAPALAKCLRAYKLVLLGRRRPSAVLAAGRGVGAAPVLALAPVLSGLGDVAVVQAGGADAALVPPALAEALAPRLGELAAHDVVRCLHALTSLHSVGAVRLDDRGKHFCRAAMKELEGRVDELSIVDVDCALRALAGLAGAPARPLWQSVGDGPDAPQLLTSGAAATVSVRRRLVKQLYAEVQAHVPSLTLEHALSIAASAEQLSHVARPGVVVELLAAEVLRELRRLKPQQVCDAVVCFGRLRYDEAGFLRTMSKTFLTKLEDFSPKQLSVTLHGLASAGAYDRSTLSLGSSVAPQIIRDFVGFTVRDLSLSLWAFAKMTHRHAPLFSKFQDGFKLTRRSDFTPQDLSMVLWSFARAGWEINPDLLSKLTHTTAERASSFPPEALVTTCIAFAKLGFAQQPLLVDVYRSLYGKLPSLTDAQLCYSFFLFSTSGLKDEALVRRYLFEVGQRLHHLRGQDLSNVLLASSRIASRELLDEVGLREGLKERSLTEVERMTPEQALSVFLAAPSVLGLQQAEALHLLAVMAEHVPQMNAAELSRCLAGAANMGAVHKPLLLPLFHHIHKAREWLTASEVTTCIAAVYSLGYCKPKFRRTLGYMLMEHVNEHRLPARDLCNLLPALGYFGYWKRLSNSLRRSVWRLASEEQRQGMTPPPPPQNPQEMAREAGGLVAPQEWRLPTIRKGFFRQRTHLLSRSQQMAKLRLSHVKEEDKAKQAERQVIDEVAPPNAAKAVADFISLVKRL